jgi:hypothetical protein
MDRRVILLGVGVAVGAIGLLVVAFMLLSPPATTMSSAGKARPTVAAVADTDTRKPIRPGSRVRIPDDPALQIVDIPAGQTVDDGGLAFSDALCKKTTDCGCEHRAPKSCATAWNFITKEQVSDVKCLLDLSCDDVCMLYQHPRPRENACIEVMSKLESDRIMGR